MKQRKPADQVVKNVLQKVIRNISIIAVFIAAAIMLVLYIGPEITLDMKFFTRLSVASIILCISIILIYELWCKSGQDKAKEEKDYQDLMREFDEKSMNMDYSTMQEYLDFEEKRRYNVEYDKYSKLILRDTELLKKIQDDIEKRRLEASKLDPKKKNDRRKIRRLLHVSLEDKLKMSSLKNKIKYYTKKRTNIVIRMPYIKSEEFDYLRYNVTSDNFKEYAPHDTRRFLVANRAKKYLTTVTFAIFGVNMLSFAGSMSGNVWYAVFMTLLSLVTLVMAIVSGFTTGYKSINIVSTGVYKTAVEYINKAQVYCERNGKELYYKEAPKYEYKEPEEEKNEEESTLPIIKVEQVEEEEQKNDKTINIS